MKRASLCFTLSLFLAACGGTSDEEGGGSGGSDGTGGQGGAGSGGAVSGSGGDSASGGQSGVCDLPFEVGNCNALIPVYTFDAAADECIAADYGGCGGNENRFDTKEECESVCGGTSTPQDCSVASDCGACLELEGCNWTADQCASQCLQDASCFGPGNDFAPSCPG